MTAPMHRLSQDPATGPPGRTSVPPVVIVSATDFPSLLRQPNGKPVGERTARLWAQAARNGVPRAMLRRPQVITGRSVWTLATVRERVARQYFLVNDEYARQISAPPSEGGRRINGPAVLVGATELARLLGVAEETVRSRRRVGTIPAEAFTLGSPHAHAVDHKVSPVWVLADIEAAYEVDRKVAADLRRTNLFE